MPCPKCGSGEVVDGLKLRAQFQGDWEAMSLIAYGAPNALVFKKAVPVPLVARACGACGFVELYASDPGALLAAAGQASGAEASTTREPTTAEDACLRCGEAMANSRSCPACGWSFDDPP